MNQDNYSPYESVRKYIRVILLDKEGKPLKLPRRDDEYTTNIDSGFEDLDLKEDATKINLYQTCEYIELWHDKKFKVVKRSFMPCVPVCLYLFLEEE